MVDAFTGILGGVLGLIVSLVVSSAVFGLSIWVYVPIKESPFRDGVAAGVKKCMAFSIAIWVLGNGILFLMSPDGSSGSVAALLVIVVFFLGMWRFFECGIFDTIIICVINIGVWICIGWLLSKLA